MASGSRIKGITVEIGGDTTDLQKSLKAVDSSLKDTQAQLKDVNKLLKLDPSNTELLRQKQDLLKKSIGETKDRLKTLKEAYKSLDGKGTEEAKQQQAALAREIADTEQSLKNLKEQYRDFGSVAKQQLTAIGEKMNEVGDKLVSAGSSLTAKVTAPIVAGFGVAMNSASDYEENINKLQVAFGDFADEVQNFTDNAQMDFGLSKNDASESAAAFGALAKGIGLSEEQAASMAVELTKLSADLGSYFNTDIEQSAGALEGIFTGNATALKKFGVVMTDVNLKEFAQSIGITAKQYAKLGAEDKTMLRFQYVMAQTTDAQGDFARTSDGTANSMKSFQASVEDLVTLIGEQVIPIVTPIIQKITEFISKLSQMDDGIAETIVKVGMILAAIGPVLVIVGSLIKGVGALTSAIGFMMSPIGLVITAIMGLIAVGVLLWKNWDTIKEKATQVWQKIKDDFEAVRQFFQDKIDWLLNKFNEFKEKIASVFDFSGLLGKVGGFFSSVGSLFSGSSGGFASGGYMSGGMMSGGGTITLYNTFTINNANVDEAMARRFANAITDQVNENLGRMV